MKIKCRGCLEFFDIPDGKGITLAICPFCEFANDLREPAESDAPKYRAPGSYPSSSAPVRVKALAHPLAPQFWILAICTLIVTAIICVSFLFTVVSMIEQAKVHADAMEEISRTLEKRNKAAEEASRTAEKASKDLQQMMQKMFSP